MAAELAGGLAVGCSCPVCGSVEHPSPAVASGTVSRADEDAARERYESADFERQAVQELVTTLATRLAVGAGAQRRPHGHALADHRDGRRDRGRDREHGRRARGQPAARRAGRARAARSRQSPPSSPRPRVSLDERSPRAGRGRRSGSTGSVAELDAPARRPPRASPPSPDSSRPTAAPWPSSRRPARRLTARERAAHELDPGDGGGRRSRRRGRVRLARRGAGGACCPAARPSPGRRQLDERRASRAAAEAVLAEEPVRAALADRARPTWPG